MNDLARCQQEARIALAAWIETGDLGALQGWVDWMIEMDYIALEVRREEVHEVLEGDQAGHDVPGVQAPEQTGGAAALPGTAKGPSDASLLPMRMRRRT